MTKSLPGFGDERQAAMTGELSGGAPLQAVPPVSNGNRLKIGPGGRVVIPADMRQSMGVVEGDMLLATLVDGELRLLSGQSALERARALVRASIPADVSLVEELFAERRRELEIDEQRGR